MFLVLCMIVFAIMAMAAFCLWILDSLSLLYPSEISTSSSPSSSSLEETALICENGGLPSYEEAVKSGWTDVQ